MESTEELKSKKENIPGQSSTGRKTLLENWLTDACGLPSFSLQAMPGDASFRRYFRVYTQSLSFVVMDAEKEKQSCHSYVAVANALRDLGVCTPDIIAADLEQGFLLLSDFGDLTYLKALTRENADPLYRQALSALALLQSCRHVPLHVVAPFTRDFMLQEWAWHKEWFLSKLLKLSNPVAEAELDDCYELLVESALAQPQVFMHRDYHSANLMVLPENKVGVLDFQDAFIGPVTYDLVSLLRDCYIDWPKAEVTTLALGYLPILANLGVLSQAGEQEFLRWFDLMGMQRHLKALLTFARKSVRDNQSDYLRHIPRTLKYLVSVSQTYPEFAVLHDYLRVTVQPAFERIYLCEA
jgi:aminoglycoside/choline kinase family phosphotransferase